MATALPVPAAAARDPNALHMASLWIAEGGLHCNVNIGVYDGHPTVTETQGWGTILADIVAVVADGLIANGIEPGPRQDTMNHIWQAFHARMTEITGA